MSTENKRQKLVQVIGQPPGGEAIEVYFFPLSDETKELVKFLKEHIDGQWRDVVHYPCNCRKTKCVTCKHELEMRRQNEFGDYEERRKRVWLLFHKIAVKGGNGEKVKGKIVRYFAFKE